MPGLRAFVERQVERAWYGGANWSRVLQPLVPLYRQAALKAKTRGQIQAQNSLLDIPVIVVGNITVGGTGKSPVVMQLVKSLKLAGYNPGVLSRGYAAKNRADQLQAESRRVTSNDSADEVGDEPLMMALALPEIPVVVDRNRLQGARFLQDQCAVDVIVCDDGLQHYALPRDIEIAVLDASRGVGNGLLIPAGPLREPVERLDSLDYLLCNGEKSELSHELQGRVDFEFTLKPLQWRHVFTDELRSLADSPVRGKVQALSGIGNPGRFHRTLHSLGLQPVAMIFPDHHQYSIQDFVSLAENESGALVMTSKDAVKCRTLAIEDNANWWVLEVAAQLPEEFTESLLKRLRKLDLNRKKQIESNRAREVE